MADDVEMIPIAGAEPPQAKPTLKLAPAIRKPVTGASTATLKPGLKLPPKPAGVLRPGLKLPTQNALKPGVRLPPKPMIRKPGSTVSAAPVPKPIAVDAQGIGKLPTVSATAVARGAAPEAVELPKPMEALKSVTQKLKGITQEIPQQAILHKTGIIAEGAMSDAQKEAAKHKTARISLADAMGVAPVKDEAAPMKTIRIKRPINIPSPTASAAPQAAATPVPTPAAEPAAAPAAAAPAAAPASTVTQRKTLKIARPGSTGVRPGGKFGVKRPASQATTIAKSAPAADAKPADGEVADIPDVPAMPTAPVPMAAKVDEGASWVWTLSAIVQLAACAVLGALVWFLYENTQLETFCGGLGWGA